MTRRHLWTRRPTVFARDGFHGASLDDVAATAGFTKGAVYSNFKSKEDLFLAVFDDRLRARGRGDAARARRSRSAVRAGSTEQLPQVRSVIERTWDDEWTALYLEFVLYAQRNPEAAREAGRERAPPARDDDRHARARRTRASACVPDFPVRVLADALDRAVRRARPRPPRRSARVHAGDAHRRAAVPVRRPIGVDNRRRPDAADDVAARSIARELAAALLPARRAQAHERVAQRGRGAGSPRGRRAWRRGPRGSGPSAWSAVSACSTASATFDAGMPFSRPSSMKPRAWSISHW